MYQILQECLYSDFYSKYPSPGQRALLGNNPDPSKTSMLWGRWCGREQVAVSSSLSVKVALYYR